ncbi:phospholipase D family protein [Candidatus Pacearchaeota archaeon]|nr:phospholipase D family protein [Candidatus Pacearchaeota archaeon]
MKTYSDKTETYLGRGAGKEIAEEIANAKESIKIISPYLSPSYVDDLLELAKKGVKVTLITSNEIEKDKSGEYSDLSDTDLIKQKRTTDEDTKNKRDKGRFYSGVGFILSLLISIFYSYTFGGIVLVVSLIAFTYFHKTRIYYYSYYSPIRLKVFPDEYHKEGRGKYLVHSKIFIIDGKVAFVGSVNYTYRGFKKSYETITKIKTYNAVEDISKEVERLFYDKGLYSKSIEEWGKELYDEKPY